LKERNIKQEHSLVRINPTDKERTGQVRSTIDLINLMRSFLLNQVDAVRGSSEDLVKSIVNEAIGEANSHGYISGLLLTKAVLEKEFNDLPKEDKKFEKFNDNWIYLRSKDSYALLEKCVPPIICHSLNKETIAKIDFKSNKFIQLLAICDEIQDWGRSVFYDQKYPSCQLTKFNKKDTKIEIGFKYEDNDWNNSNDKIAEIKTNKIEESYKIKLEKLDVLNSNDFGVNIEIHMNTNNKKIGNFPKINVSM